MPTVEYGSAGVAQRTNVYAERRMLRYAGPVIVLDKLGLTKPMPPNKSQTISFRRPRVFSAATTPLVEGVTPNTTAFRYDDVSTTLKQYGMVIEVTDAIEDTHEDPVLNDAAKQAGENAGRTVEQLIYGVVKAGTGVFYTNGTTRGAVNTVISLNKIRASMRSLKRQKALKITEILDGSVNYSTKPIEAAYVAVCHVDLEPDVRELAGFVPTAEYGSRKPICPEEFGSCEEVRFVCSPDLDPWLDAGGTAGSMLSTSGTSADVYPILLFGREAYGTVPLRGQGSIEPTILRPNVRDKADPLGQRGVVGWKLWFTAVVLNQLWMTRIECAATDL